MTARRRSPEDATLLDALIDGFERNEVLAGFHCRELPLPDEEAAVRTFASLRTIGSLPHEARRTGGVAAGARRRDRDDAPSAAGATARATAPEVVSRSTSWPMAPAVLEEALVWMETHL